MGSHRLTRPAELLGPPGEILEAHGLQLIHPWPYCAFGRADLDKSRRRSPNVAWCQCEYLQLNPPHVYSALTLDVDTNPVLDLSAVPVPNWTIYRKNNLYRCQLTYCMETPVGRHKNARSEIMDYLADIQDGLIAMTGADPGFSQCIQRNPLQPGLHHSTVFQRLEPYGLEELREWLPGKLTKAPAPERGDIGRNCDLFYAKVREAHQPRWASLIAAQGPMGQWLAWVRESNEAAARENGAQPLPDGECRSIAKSTARYSLANYAPAAFQDLQAYRSARGNGQRWHQNVAYDFEARNEEVRRLRDVELLSLQEIAARTKLTRGWVTRILSG